MHEELKKAIFNGMNERFELDRNFIERSWEDEAFKQELLSNPKAVFEKETGQELPKALEIEVIQETANKVYLVLPYNHTSDITTEGELSDEALETVAGGRCVYYTRSWEVVKRVLTLGTCERSANDLV